MSYPTEAIRGRGSRGASPHTCVEVLARVLSGTVRSTDDIADDLERPKSTVNAALHALRDAGLIDFTTGKKNTIHPVVIVVANGVR